MDNYGTHYPVLAELIENFDIKDVAEFGTGFFSTGLFTEKCDSVLSIEMQYRDWFEKVKEKYSDSIDSGVLDIQCIIEDSGLESIEFIKTEFPKRKYDLVFVDGAGGSRPNCANFAKGVTDIIVCHDTEYPGYGWSDILVNGKWKWLDIKMYGTWTSVMTKRKDVIDFVENMNYDELVSKYSNVG